MSIKMDPAVSLLHLCQGNHTIDDNVAECCGLCDQVGFNDIAFKDIFHFRLTKGISRFKPTLVSRAKY